MSRVPIGVRGLISGSITTEVTTTMTDRYNSAASQGYAIDAGGIVIVTTGPADVTVQDQNGVVLYTATGVTAGTVQTNALPIGVALPLEVVTGNLTGSVSVFWTVKK